LGGFGAEPHVAWPARADCLILTVGIELTAGQQAAPIALDRNDIVGPKPARFTRLPFGADTRRQILLRYGPFPAPVVVRWKWFGVHEKPKVHKVRRQRSKKVRKQVSK
jgi:hypothetical protein